jgi:TonB family protein
VKNLIIILFVLVHTVSYGQSKLTPKHIEKRNYQEVIGFADDDEKQDIDKFPMYPEGKKGVHKLVYKHLMYPPMAKKKGIQGDVIIQFFVDTVGEVVDIKVYKSVHPLLDQEAIRVVKKMKKWVPAQKDGQPIKVDFKLPFVFRL